MKERYDASNWNCWGRWIENLLFTSPWINYYKGDVFKKVGLNNLKGYVKGLDGYFYFLKEDQDKINFLTREKVNSKPIWFEEVFNFCKEATKSMLALEKDRSLRKLIVEMHNSIGHSMICHVLDRGIEPLLKEKCEEENIPFQKMHSFIKPPRPTEYMKYLEGLRTLKKENISDYIKRFEWIGTHGFRGKPLNEKQVLEDIKGLKAKEKNIEKVPEGFELLIRIVSELSFNRSNIIETFDRVAFTYIEELKELGKKHSLSLKEILSLTYEEILELIDKGSIPEGLTNRKERYGLLSFNKLILLSDKEFAKEMKIHEEKISKDIREVKGMGTYKGIVRGPARVVHETNEITKVKEGDILIAPETTPSYVVAMTKAAAFVTDIGGLTCHAAIISRELKKPCIIGTRIATRVFKDGDIIEVDADKGVVKKIED